MKVGLITIHDIYNYGSILQAYATQRAIQEIRLSVEIIDYKYPNETHRNAGTLQTLRTALLRTGNRTLKNFLPGRPYSRYVERYREAKETWYGQMSDRFSSPDALLANPPSYDIYVSGSDQIWHPRSSAADGSFLLGFVPDGARRVSFASSFGVRELPQSLRESYSARLRKYDFIGVRESSGVDLVRKIVGRQASINLDPTLLFDSDFWSAEAVPPKNPEPYILCYGSNSNSRYMEHLALSFAKQTGLRVVRLNGTFFDFFNRDMEYVLDAGPREWLGYIANAELVIGQSFHATAFAVTFGRPLISLLRGDENHDARQREFLSSVGAEKAILTIGEDFPRYSDYVEQDHYAARGALADLRRQSFAFLRNALG